MRKEQKNRGQTSIRLLLCYTGYISVWNSPKKFHIAIPLRNDFYSLLADDTSRIEYFWQNFMVETINMTLEWCEGIVECQRLRFVIFLALFIPFWNAEIDTY